MMIILAVLFIGNWLVSIDLGRINRNYTGYSIKLRSK
jgi:hypothetical protein